VSPGGSDSRHAASPRVRKLAKHITQHPEGTSFFTEDKMTESRERFIEARQELYRHAVPKPSTARCKYCGKAYPMGEMGCIGYGVYICRGCA
jgi:hypothetical protein